MVTFGDQLCYNGCIESEKRKDAEMYIVTDNALMETFEVEDRFELEDKLRELFDLEQEGVEEAIEHLCANIGHGYVGDDEDVLNVSVEVA